ncbi:MAG: hypothetical protein WBR18_02690 [Anaerolineales bacterium]
MASPYLDPALLNDTRLQGAVTVPGGPLGQAFFGVWLRWDGVHLMRLAQFGYEGAGVGSSTFYPLFPMLSHGLSWSTGGYVLLSGLLLSTVACVAALTLLHQMAVRTQHSDETARWSVVVLAAFPTSFFLVAPYTESTFIALTLGAFLAAYRHRWFLMAVLAGLAGLTRGPGALTAIPLAWLGWAEWRRRSAERRRWFHLVPPAAASVMAGASGLVFQAWRLRQGYPGLSDSLQRFALQVWVGPIEGTKRAVLQLFATREFLPALEVFSVLFFVTLTLWMLRRPSFRRPEWLLYMALHLFVYSGFTTLEASAWRSAARYSLTLFPGFLLLGHGLAGRSPRVRSVIVALSSTALIVLTALSSLYWFLG